MASIRYPSTDSPPIIIRWHISYSISLLKKAYVSSDIKLNSIAVVATLSSTRAYILGASEQQTVRTATSLPHYIIIVDHWGRVMAASRIYKM